MLVHASELSGWHKTRRSGHIASDCIAMKSLSVVVVTSRSAQPDVNLVYLVELKNRGHQ
jgi:hypothetical protein